MLRLLSRPHSYNLGRLPRLSPLSFAPFRQVTGLAQRRKKMAADLPSSYGSFDRLQHIKVPSTNVAVSKWQSRDSGLSVVHIDYDAPIVKGYFAVATEIFNDSGCPHTLEHLVFLGSEKYPYKGVLDNLANRAFAAGTNAWTANDHTVYTIETAGERGFLQLLPIYVDHVLYPTMTDASFVTEVHHINSEAEDAGVVYSEMQGRENTSGDLAALRQQRALYPPSSAYRSETGGLMEALRVLTADEIRQYHGSYYVPHNICLIVAGKLSTLSLLETIQTQVEPRIAEHKQANGPRPVGWKRPFMETSTAHRVALTEDKKETVEFPEKDESTGELMLSFVGPDANEFLEKKFVIDQAIDVLGTYLTDSAVAPLTKEFVEIPSPLCTYVYFSEDTRASFTELNVYLGSVPSEHLDTLDQKFKDALKRIVKEGIDMERMKLVLKRDRLRFANDLEAAGGDCFTTPIITDFLYGTADGSELAPTLDSVKNYKELATWTSKQWTDLLERFYVDNKAIVIRSRPSAKLAEKLESEEKARVAAQREKLGPEGLKKLNKLLEVSKAEHERPIPEHILTDFPVPDVASISWIPVESARNEPTGIVRRAQAAHANVYAEDEPTLEAHLNADKTELPFFVQYDHVKSDFVTVAGYLSTDTLPVHLKPFEHSHFVVWCRADGIQPDGTRLSHEELVKRLDNDTVGYDISLGQDSYFSELARVALKVEVDHYAEGIAWLRDLVYSAEFDIERLAVTIAKIQQGLPESKRDGNTVVASVSGNLLFDERSTLQASALMQQIDFIPKITQLIKDEPQTVVKHLEELRTFITSEAGLRFSVAGNVLALPEPRSAWAKNFRTLSKTELAPVPWSSRCLSELGKNPVKKAVVVSLPTIESSFAIHTTKSVSGFENPETPALRLACEVLDGTESFLWKYIRGSGLAYGANMSLDVESGLLSLSLYRCPNSYLAYAEAAKVVRGLADGSIALEETSLDAAKSSLVYSTTRSVSSPGRAALTSFANQALKGVPQDFGRVNLERIQAVTISQVQHAIKTHILPLFDSASSVAVVVSSPTKAGEIADSLGSLGFNVEARTLAVPVDEIEGDEDGSSDSDDSMVSR